MLDSSSTCSEDDDRTIVVLPAKVGVGGDVVAGVAARVVAVLTPTALSFMGGELGGTRVSGNANDEMSKYFGWESRHMK